MARIQDPAAMLILSLEIAGSLEGFLLLDHLTDPEAFHRSDAANLERFRDHAISAITKARTLAKLEEANLALKEASMVDPLTGLKNRRFLGLRMPEELAGLHRLWRTVRTQDTSRIAQNTYMLFYMVDLDHFKAVNDTWGHAAGDAVLRQASAALRGACRESDMVVRWGGEEFLVVARNADLAFASRLAANLLEAVAGTEFDLGQGMSIRKTCSIGFASFPVLAGSPEAFTWEEAVALADLCLYAAKRSGRNAWVGLEATPSAGDLKMADLMAVTDRIQAGDISILTSFPPGTPLDWPSV
jgi:diguanylate cyclase (GGDEF)-like protein